MKLQHFPLCWFPPDPIDAVRKDKLMGRFVFPAHFYCYEIGVIDIICGSSNSALPLQDFERRKIACLDYVFDPIRIILINRRWEDPSNSSPYIRASKHLSLAAHAECFAGLYLDTRQSRK